MALRKSILILLLSALLAMATWSCKKENEISLDPSLVVEFSSDSVLFDTVFTNQGTAFQYIWVYNRNSVALEFDEIKLSGSNFQVLINGQYQTSINGFYLPKNDSILLLIRANINPQNSNTPFVVNENLLFTRAGLTQALPLQAYGRDAIYLTNYTCSCAETWSDGKPYILMGTIHVPATCTLQVNAGAELFFHKGASLSVDGTLLMQGTASNTIVVSSDKIDNTKNSPGSWDGIRFNNGSNNNAIEYARISGGTNAITSNLTDDGDTIAELKIKNTILYNSSENLIHLTGTDFYASNLLLYNSIGALMEISEGTVYVDHGSLVNLNAYARTKSSVVYSGNGKTRFRNVIVWGNKTNELDITAGNFSLDHALIKGSGISGNSIIENTDPKFVSPYEQNFELNDGSPCLDAGSSMPGISIDLLDQPRDSNPDLGAFEKQ